MLVEGEPPAKVHAYDAMLPSVSDPEPANETARPGLIVTFDDGLPIVAVGT